jgi:AcrR family transcriptional regulator
MQQAKHIQRSPGRPREFDIGDALDKAIAVFRERGFHATSIADLKAAMSLASGSIYKAFKDKPAIFLAALARYIGKRNELATQRFAAAGSGRERLRALLDIYAESSHGEEGRRGCLVVGSTVELATFDPDVRASVTAAVKRNEALFAELIAQGQADGSIASQRDPKALALLMLCIAGGMRVAGKTGRSRKEMTAVVDTAMTLLD